MTGAVLGVLHVWDSRDHVTDIRLNHMKSVRFSLIVNIYTSDLIYFQIEHQCSALQA